ncbi:MAG: PEP-CTERM sorting domain-containing protein [Tepidisphaeraceae bacterium]
MSQRKQVKRVKRSNGVTSALVGGSLLAGALLVAPAPASAALVYDVRLSSGGGKSLTATAGSTFSVDVYAVVTGANATATDDGFTNGFFSLMSNNTVSDSSSGLTITGGGPVAPFNSGSQAGLIQDIDADGDLDVGKDSGQSGNVNFVAPRTGTIGGELGTGTGAAEFKLATYTVSVGAGAGSGNASLNLVLPGQNGTGTVVLATPILYRQDGAPVNTLTSVSVGSPVVVAVPEPAALGVLGLGAFGLFVRRRSR